MSRRDEFIQIAQTVPYDDTVQTPLSGSDDTQGVIDYLKNKVATSASPGFSFGRSGNTPSGTWLLRPGSVPSNKTGIPIGFSSPKITLIAVGNELVSTFDIQIYEHEGDEVNLTLLTTVSIVSSRTATFNVDVPATAGRQLAVHVSSGSCKNPGVDIQLSGGV